MTEAPLNVTTLLAEGQLSAAVDRLTARVRSAPADHATRTTLAELLCLTGEFDRAEIQLGLVAQQTADRPIAVARLRHLIRAATAREAWFNEAAVPALLAEPTTLQRVAIDLALALRASDATAAASLMQQAEALRPHLAGTVDGVPFDDMRDVDDRSAWFLEVLTHDGGYLWVDMASLAGLRFEPATRPIDLLWRQARMALRDGRVADVAIPAQYVDARATESHRLAQATDWHEEPSGFYRGTGQRMVLLGDDARGILDINEIVFTPDRTRGSE